MADCGYGTMEWYCCLSEGHDGPHRSHPLPKPTCEHKRPRVIPDPFGNFEGPDGAQEVRCANCNALLRF